MTNIDIIPQGHNDLKLNKIARLYCVYKGDLHFMVLSTNKVLLKKFFRRCLNILIKPKIIISDHLQSFTEK